jgi:cysteinyl-tRNA synthetase
MPLQIHNTLSRTKETFIPLVEGRVGMYVCGPTVYGHAHLGHAKSYVSFDVIVRYLRFLGYAVLYVQNITDVGHLTDDADEGEDKLARQSAKEKMHPMQVAEFYTRSYLDDMDLLGNVRADIMPRATGHMTEQIALVQTLIDRNLAYHVNGSVYFDVARFAGYGKLSGRSVDDMESGARVEVNPEKRHPADFALWKRAEPNHIMRWPSPWGDGFPGWHLECSAMSGKYLGETFDIHGGGLENQFPHHECEIAQSEGAHGKPFVRYWIHNNMVTVDGKKMGKSLGNFITLKDAFARWGPEVVRFFILQSHYRSTLDFSEEALAGAATGLEKLRNTVRNLDDRIRRSNEAGDPTGIDSQAFEAQFREAMDDDFNFPQALAVLFDLSRAVNQVLAREAAMAIEGLRELRTLYDRLASGVLGISLAQAAGGQGEADLTPALMDVLIGVRGEIRTQKLWPLSDFIRDGLAGLGIVLEDKKTGTSWKRTR